MDSVNPSRLAALVPGPAALERMVYLVGPARGGTSVIHMAMDVHPKALVLPGVTHFLQQVWRYRNKVHERLLRMILRSAQCWHNDAILARLDADQNAEFIRLVNAAFKSRGLAPLYKLYPVAYALSPDFAKIPSEIACWHDKSNDWRHLGPLAAAFPAAKFIFVVRDPRSVALSGALRMSVKEGEAVARADAASLIDMALYWRLMVQRCLAFAQRHPERCRIVRFEDFLAAPAVTLRELFRFTVGDAPTEEVIERGLANVIGGASNEAGEYRGISREPMQRWRTALAPSDIALVEQVTAPTARKAGYEIGRGRGVAGSLKAVRLLDGAKARARATAKVLIEEVYELRVRAARPPAQIAPALRPQRG